MILPILLIATTAVVILNFRALAHHKESMLWNSIKIPTKTRLRVVK